MSNSSSQPIDRTQSDGTTMGQSEPGINSDEGVLHIPQSSRAGVLQSVITRTFIEGSYPSAEMKSMYSTTHFNPNHRGNEGVHNFLKGISPKVHIIA